MDSWWGKSQTLPWVGMYWVDLEISLEPQNINWSKGDVHPLCIIIDNLKLIVNREVRGRCVAGWSNQTSDQWLPLLTAQSRITRGWEVCALKDLFQSVLLSDKPTSLALACHLRDFRHQSKAYWCFILSDNQMQPLQLCHHGENPGPYYHIWGKRSLTSLKWHRGQSVSCDAFQSSLGCSTPRQLCGRLWLTRPLPCPCHFGPKATLLLCICFEN